MEPRHPTAVMNWTFTQSLGIKKYNIGFFNEDDYIYNKISYTVLENLNTQNSTVND